MNYYKIKTRAIRHIKQLRKAEIYEDQIILQVLTIYGFGEKFTKDIIKRLDKQDIQVLKDDDKTTKEITNFS